MFSLAIVTHTTAGLSRKDADGIGSQLVSRFKDDLDKRPIGKHFSDVYDIVTIHPKPERLELYEDVKGELREIGLII